MLHKNGRCQPLLFRILMTFNHTINKVTLVVVRDAPIPLFYKPIRVRVFLFVYLPIPSTDADTS